MARCNQVLKINNNEKIIILLISITIYDFIASIIDRQLVIKYFKSLIKIIIIKNIISLNIF